jgi:hypothetical protein
MLKKWGPWLGAVVITLASVVWQRRTGPTYPVRGTVDVGGTSLSVALTRSHGGLGDQPVRIEAKDVAIGGMVVWRRFPTDDPWRTIAMSRNGDWLEAVLPHQPPAGKLEYEVKLVKGADSATFPPRPAVTRFKGDVNPFVLVPHVLAMFVGMFLSSVTGLKALIPGEKLNRLAGHTLLLLCIGGGILGPRVQKEAFGAYWTGIPFGWDLTDNKTLIAIVAWAIAVWAIRGGRSARLPVVFAALVTLVVYVIPHSVWGSQIDWKKVPAAGGAPSATS